MSSTRIDQIRRAAQTWVDRGDMQGLVLVAARRGVIVLHEAWGTQTPEENSPPATVKSLFPLASISKVITATAIMCLVEDGLVGLNRPVHEYIPEYQGENKQQVMVHHLLTHTSGWNSDALQEALVQEFEGTAPLSVLVGREHIAKELAFTCTVPLETVPGERMWYSSAHFELLGEIVRRASGQPLEEFVQARIFGPLGMKDSYFVVPEAESARVVRRPQGAWGAVYEMREVQDAPWAAAGAYSTALDMATFCQMFLNGGSYGGERVLSPAAVHEMTRNQIPGVSARFLDEFFPEASWSYGWSIHGSKRGFCGALYSPHAFEHWGAGGAYVWGDPVYETVGISFAIDRRARNDPEADTCWRSDLFTDMVTAAANGA